METVSSTSAAGKTRLLLLLLSRFSRVLSVRPHRWQPIRLPHPWDSPGKNTGVGCHFLLQCMKVKSESEVTQAYPTLHNPMDCSPPGSSVHGIFLARVLEWVAIAFSEISLNLLIFFFSDLIALAALISSRLPKCEERINFSLILNFKENASNSFLFL